MIFPVIECDSVIQVGDKFRIMADKTYKTPDADDWDAIEVDPGDGSGFIDISGDLNKPKASQYWYLDFQYATAGTKTISLKATAGLASETATFQVTVLTAAQDNLFSTDQMIKEIQEDVFKLLPDGRSSFKYKHRRNSSQKPHSMKGRKI